VWAVKQWEMTSLLCAHCLPVNRAFLEPEIGLEDAFVLLIWQLWQKKHDKWQNSHGARLQKQLQTALILSVTLI
jgi:hypothetical protein